MKRHPLTSIRSENDLDAAQAVVDDLLREELDDGKQAYLDALSDLVIVYEQEHHAVAPLPPHELLAQMLEERGMSQAELARTAGLAKATVSDLATGKRPFHGQANASGGQHLWAAGDRVPAENRDQPLAIALNDQALCELLARFPARFQPLSPLESLGGGGGLSGARLWRFRAEHGALLLRAWPSHGPGTRSHRTGPSLALQGGGPGIRPRSDPRSRGSVPARMAWLTLGNHSLAVGGADPSCPPSSRIYGLPSQVWRRSISVWLVNRSKAFPRACGSGTMKSVSYSGAGFAPSRRAVNRQGDAGAPCQRAAHRWLSLARAAAPILLDPLGRASTHITRLQPCLRDARPEHFLFEGDRLSGLVDFGAMGVDSVAGDLARLIGEWLDGDPAARREALASYERVRPLDPVEARLIGVFEATTALLIGERWLRWHYVDNRRFDDPQAVSKGLERGLKQLERLMGGLAGSGLAN